MDKIDEIKSLISPVLEQMAIELVDIQVHGTGNRTILRIYVDEPGGISLNRCTQASRQISDMLDRKDPIHSRYVLQVSSPGLDRPLKTVRDFIRNIGKNVHIDYIQDQEQTQLTGKIVNADEDHIEIETNDKIVRLGMSQIVLTKPVIEFN